MYLNIGLGVILGFVGVKMLFEKWVHVSTALSLLFIVVALSTTVFFSLRAKPEQRLAPPDLDAILDEMLGDDPPAQD